MAVRFGSGLIATPNLMAAQVMSVDMQFEPSIGLMARKIDRLGGKIKHFRTPLKEALKHVIIPSIQTNFHKSGRPRWVDLAESTWNKKRPGSKILIETGALMRTMGYMNIWTIKDDVLMLTDLPQSVWYGKVHQGGLGEHDVQEDFAFPEGHRGSPVSMGHRNLGESGSIPPRPFVMFQDEDLPKIDEIFVLWLGEQVREVGL